MKKLFMIAALLILALGASHANDPSSPYPEHFSYKGMLVNENGQAIDGMFPVSIRLMADANRELAKQQFANVRFEAGRFELLIGKSSTMNFQSLASQHSQMLLEISVDGQLYGPLIGIQPAGHSMKTRLALSGADTGEGKLHSKGFALRSQTTATQAVTLKPALTANAIELMRGRRTNPYTVEMRGPYISEPLSSLPVIRENLPFVEKEVNPPRHEVLFDANGRRFGTENPADVDDALAGLSTQVPDGDPTPAPALNFEGLGNVNGVLPPDIEGTVGPNHFIQAINLSFAVFDKSGTLLAGPSNTNTLWTGFGGPCQNTNNGDPIFLYDQQADRYVLTQFAVSGAQSVCFAVSTTSDPLGTYFLYELPAQRFPDYYKLGVWPVPDNNAYFMTTNSGTPGAYDVYAIDRESLLAGVTPRPAQFFQSFPNLLMPADSDGALPPPQGSPGLLYTIIAGGEDYFSTPPPANDSIDLFEYDVDWGNAANSTFTMVNSFAPPEITDFIWTVCGFFQSNCLPQPGTGVGLDSGSWWPMQRFQYRNFGSHETLLGTWTIDVLAAGDQAAPRWFELRRDSTRGSGWSVFQEGTQAPDAANRWEPSISMNGQGDIGMVYSILDAGGNVFPGIRYAGRRESDPAGTMRTEASLIEGSGVQTSSSNRWGDYASMDVDPADDCTFWFTSEYIQNSGNANWQTRVGTFNFPDCVSVVTSNTSQAVCSADDAVSYDLTLAGNFNGSTNLTVNNCPAGAVCGFSVNPVINPATDSQLQLTDLSTGVASGDYLISLTATDSVNASLTFDANVALTVVDGLPNGTTLTAPADAAVLVSTQSREFSWAAMANTSSYRFELATDAGFTNIIETATVGGTGYTSALALDAETTYYWRVTTANLCGDGATSQVFSFTTAPLPGDCLAGSFPTEINNYTFEVDAEGWTSTSLSGSNSWNLSTANPDTGAQHWHIDDIATASDTVLVSPPIALPSGQSPLTLQFNNYQNMESNGPSACWDGGVLEVSTDGGNNFITIQTDKMLTDPYDGPFQSNSVIFGEDGWCGDPQPYLNSIVDIDDYAGQTVQFRFRMTTDGAVSDEGWDIDDVMIQSCELDVGTIFVDGFED